MTGLALSTWHPLPHHCGAEESISQDYPFPPLPLSTGSSPSNRWHRYHTRTYHTQVFEKMQEKTANCCLACSFFHQKVLLGLDPLVQTEVSAHCSPVKPVHHYHPRKRRRAQKLQEEEEEDERRFVR